MNNKTAVYMRVSTPAQDVRSQRNDIERYLTGHNITVPDERWYTDEGVSGKTLDRPGFKRLQAAVFAGEVDTVIMASIKRFARTMIDGIVEVDKWQQVKCELVLVREGWKIDPSSWAGGAMFKCMVAMHLAFAEEERERIRARCAAGRRSTIPMQR
jgi:site-specific DNA recombinase